jgi:hypothetical protein
MRQREQIEGDLIQISARLHDLALCGIAGENLNEIRLLTEAITTLTREADCYVPQLLNFTPNGRRTQQGWEPLAKRIGPSGLGIETSAVRHLRIAHVEHGEAIQGLREEAG